VPKSTMPWHSVERKVPSIQTSNSASSGWGWSWSTTWNK
jgi:hypothetical protein